MFSLTPLRSFGAEILRTVMTSQCVACGEELPWSNRVASCCGKCWAALPKITTATCVSCAEPWSGAPAGEAYRCIECYKAPLPVAWSDAWGHYKGSLEAVLQSFKFRNHEFLASGLATLLAERLDARGDLDFDCVTPVPMHRRKLRRRGYNQAELLSQSLCSQTKLQHAPRLLRKEIERQTQSTLDRKERAANVRGAYRASSDAADKSILLVDDICTTGETFRACASVLIAAGAKRVAALAVARA